MKKMKKIILKKMKYDSEFSFPRTIFHPQVWIREVHWISTSAGVFNPCTTILAVVVLLFLVGMALAYARRQPVVAFGLLFVLIHLIVESTIVNLEMVFEHRMYLPMAAASTKMMFSGSQWLKLHFSYNFVLFRRISG